MAAMKIILRTAAVVFAILSVSAPARAATKSYTCNSSSNQWSHAANWLPAGVPQNGDTLIFGNLAGNRGTVNDLPNLRVDSIQFTAGGYQVYGNAISITNGIIAAAANLLDIYVDFTLGKSQTIDIDAVSSTRLYGDVNLNGFNLAIDSDAYFEIVNSFSGTGNISKNGAGRMILAGAANTFTGTFTHFNGELWVAKPGCFSTAFVSYGPSVIYNSGATGTNCDVRLNFGSSMTSSSTVTNTIRHLTVQGALVEEPSLTFVLRGNLTNYSWSTESHIFAHLVLSDTNHFFHVENGLPENDLVLGWASITGGSKAGFSKTGPGKLYCVGFGSGQGGTNHIVSGVLEADINCNPLGAGRTVVHDGASINARGGSSLTSAFELHGSGVGGTNGAIRGFGLAQVHGSFLIVSNVSVRSEGALHLDGNIGGFGTFHIEGTNEVWTEGSSANTLIGGYRVEGGVFVLNKPDGVAAVGSEIIVGGDFLFDPQPATLRNFGNEQIVSHVVIAPSGRYEVNGQTETLPSMDLYNAAQVDMDGGTIVLAGDLQTLPAAFATATATFDGGGFLNVGTGTRNIIVNDTPAGAGDALELNLFTTTLSGSANIIKKGNGDMRISYDTTHTGTFTIEAGDVEVQAINSFGSSGAPTVVTGPGALVMSGIAFSDVEPMTFNGTGRVDSATLVLKDDTSLRGPMTVQQMTRMHVATNAQFALRSPVSGAGGIIKEGPGELLFDWTQANTFSGGLVVEDGLVTLNRDNTNNTIVSAIAVGDGVGAAGSARLVSTYRQQIGNAVDVTVFSDGRFTITNMNEVEIIRRLQGSGQVVIHGYGLRFNDSGLDSTFNGSISGTGDLFKAGTGRFTHNGVCNASGLLLSLYGGETTINGTWNASPTPTLIDAWSGTVLSGEGIVQNVNIRSGATLSPGNSPGIFTANTVTLNSGANLFLELRGTQPGVSHDQLVVKTDLNCTNAALTLSVNFPPAEGQVLRLVDNQGANPIHGAFSGKPEGTLLNISGNQFVLSYVGGSGNDLTLTATNMELGLLSALIPNGNGLVDAGECNELVVVLTNKSGGSLSGVTATLDSLSPAIAVSQQNAAFANFTANSTRTNLAPFRISSLPGFACGQLVELRLTITVPGAGTFSIPITLTTGLPATTATYNSVTPVTIADLATTNSTINVASFNAYVSKVVVSFHITHTYAADLEVSLQSPSGKLVKLVADRGGSGDNFGTSCSPTTARTTFDDSSRNDIAAAAAPFAGTFSPEEPLTDFRGEWGNGAWKLVITDDAGGDTGTLNCWTLTLYYAACSADSASGCAPCVSQTAGALNAQSPTMTQRMFRDAHPTLCSETKTCPGPSAAVGNFRYATHTFTNTGAGGCMTVVLRDHCGNSSLFAAAYLGAFNPADLCAGYLADIGTNALAPSMSFHAASNAVFTVVVNELFSGAGCSSYHLEMFGLPCPPPRVQVAPAPSGKVRLFWNALGGDGFDVQAAPVVTGPFTNVGFVPAYINGTFNVTNAASPNLKFFRLKKP
jgi:autotransporter-associated beta strand protein